MARLLTTPQAWIRCTFLEINHRCVHGGRKNHFLGQPCGRCRNLRFFKLCQQIDLDAETGRTAGLYAKRFSKAYQGISLEDFLLAATARVHQCPLWPHNRKHYPMDDVVLFGA